MAFELQSGAAVLPEIGAMYGENAVSETALVRNLFLQVPADGVVMGDSGFGIFSVAYEAQQVGRDFLLRLTASRFNAMVRTAQLHEIRIHDTLSLYLVTDVSDSALELAELSRRRNKAEIDIRNFKVVINAEMRRVKSNEMLQKELWMSLVSYNQVGEFRREAARQAKVIPRKLSFQKVLTTFMTFLLEKKFTTAASWSAGYKLALHDAMKDTLPNRPNRSYEREASQKRPKSPQFKKRIPPKAVLEPEK